MIKMGEPTTIHPTAIISPKAEIGSNVTIGPYSIIGNDVVLRDEVRVGSHCVIEGPSEFGSGTVFFPFVSAGQAPHALKYKSEPGRLLVGGGKTFRGVPNLLRGTQSGGHLARNRSHKLSLS